MTCLCVQIHVINDFSVKLEKLEKNIFDLKQEITRSFYGYVQAGRVKRLRKDSDTVPACSKTTQNKLTRPLFIK